VGPVRHPNGASYGFTARRKHRMRTSFYVTSTIVWLLLVSGLAGTISVYLFRELDNEHRLKNQVLLQLPAGTSAVSLHHSESKPGCFGSISYSLTADKGQTTISSQAWIALSINGKERIIEGSCDLLFNALGQFGTSFCKTQLEGTEIRLGTTNIDPITLEVFLGRESTAPIVQQHFPGPVTIASDGGRYSVSAPFSSSVNLPDLSELRKLAQLPHITTTQQACDRETRTPLTVPLSTLRTIHQRATNLIPKGLL
jgi:hypothetical protein